MGYTLSFIADVKCGMGDVYGLLHHDARSVDQANGCETRHSNKDIDSGRTRLNDVVVSDGKGGWVPCTDTRQIMSALSDRLSHVKKPLRHDAVVLRPMVLQLDPEWYKAHTDAVDRDTAEQHMMDWAADTFGADNLVYVAAHHDEGNPHLHIGFCPVTSDGRLAQKDWFSGPTRLREMHNEFRQHMAAAGYDVDMQRRKPGKHARRMSVDEYKDFARLQDERQDVEQQREDLDKYRAGVRYEAQQLRQRAAWQVSDADKYAQGKHQEADEYYRRRRHDADQDADKVRQQAEQEAEATRKAADQYAQRVKAEADAKAAAALDTVRQRIQSSIDQAKQERDQVVRERDATRAALQGDLATWGELTPRPTANKLLGVLGAAVRASRQQPTTPGLGSAYARMMAMVRAADARDNPGPTAVEGPTM